MGGPGDIFGVRDICILSLVINVHMYVGVGRHFLGAGQNCNIFVSHIYFKYVFMYVQIVHSAS